MYVEDTQQTISFVFSNVYAGVTEYTVLAAVKESVDKLQHIVKQFTQTLHNDRDSQNGNEDLEQTKALLNRIQFLHAFYHSLVLDKQTLSDLEN